MIERIKANLPSKLEIIDDVNMEYLICSQMVHEHWYPFNLGAWYCECEDRLSICRHLLDVRKLVEEEFMYLKCMLHVEEDGFVNNFDDVGENDVVSPPHSPQPNSLSLSMNDIGL